MGMSKSIEETLDKYELFLDLYGRKRLADEKKKDREKAFEEIALNLLKLKIHQDDIIKATGISPERLIQLAQDNNLTISPR